MSGANNTPDSNGVVINVTLNISGNVVFGNNNVIIEIGSQSNTSTEKKSALGELFNKVGKFIAKIVSKIKGLFLPKK